MVEGGLKGDVGDGEYYNVLIREQSSQIDFGVCCVILVIYYVLSGRFTLYTEPTWKRCNQG